MTSLITSVTPVLTSYANFWSLPYMPINRNIYDYSLGAIPAYNSTGVRYNHSQDTITPMAPSVILKLSPEARALLNQDLNLMSNSL